ncbi:hypothetical protein HPP92_029154 [Vanilla planifolia]|uniref:Uncharacterized protein n=1 Tax=Vanilla planifolia TaxID=51239 RepID=A0A835P5W8_VANPL|nr:hypothetical protein HPP92_029154 [Vanilla planifolia]KAG0445832.1 hypothetical protein HPP92_029143 [Vanilla planifolia]
MLRQTSKLCHASGVETVRPQDRASVITIRWDGEHRRERRRKESGDEPATAGRLLFPLPFQTRPRVETGPERALRAAIVARRGRGTNKSSAPTGAGDRVCALR